MQCLRFGSLKQWICWCECIEPATPMYNCRSVSMRKARIFDQYKVRSPTFAGTWIGKQLTLLITTIVRLSFDCGLFAALNKVWKQVDGTSIGNQISPVLSSLPMVMTGARLACKLPADFPSDLPCEVC